MQTTTETEVAPKKKRKLSIFAILLIAPVVIVLLLSLAAVWHHFHLGSEISAELERINKRGEPITPAEVSAAYALPAGTVDRTSEWLSVLERVKNATSNPAYAALPIIGTSEDDVPFPGDPWADEPTVAQLMQELAPTLEELERLAEDPEAVRFPIAFEDGFAALLEHVQDIRQVARVLSLRARWQLHQGDSEGALQSLITLSRLPDTLKHEPIMISQLVRIAIDGIMIQDVLDFIPYANWSDAQLKQLQEELLAGESFETIMHRSLIGERALGNMVFEDPESIGTEIPVGFAFTRKADQLYYLQTYSRMIEASEKPYAEAMSEFEAIESEMQEQSKIQQIRHMLTNLILPASSAMQKATVRATVSRQAAVTLVVCQRYKLANGDYPAKLADLVPEFLDRVPTDPFDGRPLRYVLIPDEVIVYSVGDNLIDDGGIATEESGYQEPDKVYSLKILE